jgi:hypothetical protein
MDLAEGVVQRAEQQQPRRRGRADGLVDEDRQWGAIEANVARMNTSAVTTCGRRRVIGRMIDAPYTNLNLASAP